MLQYVLTLKTICKYINSIVSLLYSERKQSQNNTNYSIYTKYHKWECESELKADLVVI